MPRRGVESDRWRGLSIGLDGANPHGRLPARGFAAGGIAAGTLGPRQDMRLVDPDVRVVTVARIEL